MIGYQHVATNRACQVLWKHTTWLVFWPRYAVATRWISAFRGLSERSNYLPSSLTYFRGFEPLGRVPIERHGRPRPCERGPTIVGRMSTSEPFDGTRDQGDAMKMFCNLRRLSTRKVCFWWFQDESESIPLCSNLRFVSKKRILLTNFTQMFQCNRF